eukprot:1159490-Pelagomonas_calceolata.AAC.9
MLQAHPHPQQPRAAAAAAAVALAAPPAAAAGAHKHPKQPALSKRHSCGQPPQKSDMRQSKSDTHPCDNIHIHTQTHAHTHTHAQEQEMCREGSLQDTTVSSIS